MPFKSLDDSNKNNHGNSLETIRKKIAKKKKKAIEYRRQGACLSDCASLVEVNRRTLYYWKANDKKFLKALKKAWSDFKLSSVRLTAKKDPRFILSHIDKRFKEEEKDETKNQFNQFNIKVSNDKLADWIIEITGGLNQEANSGSIEQIESS